ncbi:hypothetical protein M1466_03865 [Candidatus Dependentiae bacterium]|nr:hypothetical protein [Candidatus Dependentiae bacterium]
MQMATIAQQLSLWLLMSLWSTSQLLIAVHHEPNAPIVNNKITKTTHALLTNAQHNLQQAIATKSKQGSQSIKPSSPAAINFFDVATFPTATQRYNEAYVFPASSLVPDITTTSIVNVPGTPFSFVRLDNNGLPINIDGSQAAGTTPTAEAFTQQKVKTLAADGQNISYLLVPMPTTEREDFNSSLQALLNSDPALLANNIYVFQPGHTYVFVRSDFYVSGGTADNPLLIIGDQDKELLQAILAAVHLPASQNSVELSLAQLQALQLSPTVQQRLQHILALLSPMIAQKQKLL